MQRREISNIEIKNRVDIKDFVLKIEQDFPVNQWKIEGLHIWPVIRLRLFFHLLKALEVNRNIETAEIEERVLPKKTPFKKKIKNKLRLVKRIFQYSSFLRKLSKKEHVFFGTNAHRVSYKNKRFNRFFDVIIEQQELQGSSIVFEYDTNSITNYYNQTLVTKYDLAYVGFEILQKWKRSFVFRKKEEELAGYKEFLSFLEGQTKTALFAKQYSENKLYASFSGILAKIRFFKKVFKKIAPKQIAILCYYGNDMFAATAAANSLGINTIEMQHGPQTDIHLAYGNWSVVPEQGYDLLPRIYWCWDENSVKTIERWASKNSLYRATMIGNPWVNYWKEKKDNFAQKDYILYCSQPSPISLPQLFPEQLVSFIKKESYQWFLRLHPRQLQDKEELISFLKKNEIWSLVNLEEATQAALPRLLNNCKVHLTHFSGTTIEANLFGKTTILLHENGPESFPELIAKGNATFIAHDDERLYEKIKEYLVKL